MEAHRRGLAQPCEVGRLQLAVNEMVERTSTRVAPWTLVEGNDKNFARIKVLKTLADRVERRLNKSS